jgi:hypothetical protein
LQESFMDFLNVSIDIDIDIHQFSRNGKRILR